MNALTDSSQQTSGWFCHDTHITDRSQRGQGLAQGRTHVGQGWDLTQNRHFQPTTLSCRTLCLPLPSPALIWLPFCSSLNSVLFVPVPAPGLTQVPVFCTWLLYPVTISSPRCSSLLQVTSPERPSLLQATLYPPVEPSCACLGGWLPLTLEWALVPCLLWGLVGRLDVGVPSSAGPGAQTCPSLPQISLSFPSTPEGRAPVIAVTTT